MQSKPKEGDRTPWRVVALLGACGFLSTAMVGFLIILAGHNAIFVLLLASTIFAAFIEIGIWAAIEQKWLAIPLRQLRNRGMGTALLIVLSYPIGAILLGVLVFGLSSPLSWDFDEHPQSDFTAVELVRDRLAFPVGVLVAGTAILLISSVAVYLLVGKWPKHVTSTLIIPTFGALTALAGPVVATPLILAGPSILGAILGYWAWTASERPINISAVERALSRG